MKYVLPAALSALMLSTPSWAVTYTLDFAAPTCLDSVGIPLACSNGTVISQDYGDTALVDVSHGQDVDNPGVGLVWWTSGYSDLTGVGWGGPTSALVSAFLRLVPAAGYEVTLLSFQLGAWTREFTTPVSVLDSLVTTDFGDVTIPFPDSTTFDGPFGPAEFVEIRWGAPWWVAIDNVTFSVTPIDGNGGGGNGGGGGIAPVPLPAGGLLLLGGLAGLGIAARRRG